MPGWDNPGNDLRGSLQRPSFIGWEMNGVEKRINFTWDYPLHHFGLTYTLATAEQSRPTCRETSCRTTYLAGIMQDTTMTETDDKPPVTVLYSIGLMNRANRQTFRS